MTDKIVDRRSALTGVLVAAAGAGALAACSPAAETVASVAPPEPVPGTPVEGGWVAVGGDVVANPVLLYCHLKVDPAKEQEMLDHFHNKFKPVGAKFKGFIDLKMLKLRTLIQGDKLPAGVNYRFQLTYQNEELRQIWIASPEHAEFWPGIENTLTDKNFHVALFDSV